MQRTAAGYDTDFALWAKEQAAALREGRFGDLDLANLTEEIDDLSRRLRHKIVSHLIVLQWHLLKQQYQPERVLKSWRNTIREQSPAARTRVRGSALRCAVSSQTSSRAPIETRGQRRAMRQIYR